MLCAVLPGCSNAVNDFESRRTEITEIAENYYADLDRGDAESALGRTDYMVRAAQLKFATECDELLTNSFYSTVAKRPSGFTMQETVYREDRSGRHGTVSGTYTIEGYPKPVEVRLEFVFPEGEKPLIDAMDSGKLAVGLQINTPTTGRGSVTVNGACGNVSPEDNDGLSSYVLRLRVLPGEYTIGYSNTESGVAPSKTILATGDRNEPDASRSKNQGIDFVN